MAEFYKIKEKTNKYIMPTYGRFELALVSGKGATAFDADGKKYIDMGSGIGVNVLGYSDEGWVKAVSEQAAKLSHISNLYYSPIQGELSEMLCNLTGFGSVFFCNSGAEANEGMIKLARKASFDKYGKGRSTIIALNNSFHGRTITTLAATGQDNFHNYFFPFTEGFKFAEANDLESVKAALTDDVCGIMLEGVQGEGGVYPLDFNFVKGVAALCKEKDILLLFDEVQTGIGRTGKMFSFEHFGVSPDVISCAKALGGGLPFGAVLCTEALKGTLSAGTHGTTFGGNPIACAGSIEVLKRVSAKGFLDEVNEKAAYIRARLEKIKGVKKIRGLGLMIGFEVEGAQSKDLVAKLIENGLIVLTAKAAVRLLPPLNISKTELDTALDILENTINKYPNGGAK